jgi:hypothetical protein
MAETVDLFRSDTVETIMDVLDEDTLDEAFEKDIAAVFEVVHIKLYILEKNILI